MANRHLIRWQQLLQRIRDCNTILCAFQAEVDLALDASVMLHDLYQYQL